MLVALWTLFHLTLITILSAESPSFFPLDIKRSRGWERPSGLLAGGPDVSAPSPAAPPPLLTPMLHQACHASLIVRSCLFSLVSHSPGHGILPTGLSTLHSPLWVLCSIGSWGREPELPSQTWAFPFHEHTPDSDLQLPPSCDGNRPLCPFLVRVLCDCAAHHCATQSSAPQPSSRAAPAHPRQNNLLTSHPQVQTWHCLSSLALWLSTGCYVPQTGKNSNND